MKLSDYVAARVVELGIRHVFMITGGGAMHLNQSLGSHSNLECVFNHHEQASAIAAESYCRLTNKLALVNVTSGPGGTNAITGVYGAWTDSISMLVISGQVKYETTIVSSGLPLRQLGDQEADIVSLVHPIVKYAVMIDDPTTIRYHLEKAIYLARVGRPGPCWIDIPVDIQAAQVVPEELIGFDPEELHQTQLVSQDQPYLQLVQQVFEKIRQSKRPVIFAGTGVRLCGQHQAFLEVIDKLGIPVVTAWNAHDALWNDHPCYAGKPGTVGDRAGNFVVQNADLILVLGSRLNIRQVSYNWASFAKRAYKIWVDIDPLELQKPTVKPDLAIVADLARLLPVMATCDYMGNLQEHQAWLSWCKERVQRYPVVLPEYWQNPKINPYCFIDELFRQLGEEAIVVTGNGTACVVGFQAAYLKKGQRLYTNSGCASMGYDLPAAIGACEASGRKPVICLTGDGSIMMNLQELQTIAGYGLPIKIFILNNAGYISIRQTHEIFFSGNKVGADQDSGISLPNFQNIANAFGMDFFKISSYVGMNSTIEEVLAEKGPVFCEVILDPSYSFSPKLASKQLADGRIISSSLEDMAPFLSEKELENNIYKEK